MVNDAKALWAEARAAYVMACMIESQANDVYARLRLGDADSDRDTYLDLKREFNRLQSESNQIFRTFLDAQSRVSAHVHPIAISREEVRTANWRLSTLQALRQGFSAHLRQILTRLDAIEEKLHKIRPR